MKVKLYLLLGAHFQWLGAVQVQFSSVPSLIGSLGGGGGLKDNSAEILFKSFLQETLVSSSGKGKEVSLFDVIHPAFPLPTTALPTLQGFLKDVLDRLSWHVTCPNHASFCLLTVASSSSVDPQES